MGVKTATFFGAYTEDVFFLRNEGKLSMYENKEKKNEKKKFVNAHVKL